MTASRSSDSVVVVGAGIAGLAAAIRLSAKGMAVTVVDKATAPGGKMRQIDIDGLGIDSGPTVLTMRWVFDDLFEAAGTKVDTHLSLDPAEILARHAWSGSERLDLFADIERSAAAIEAFSSRAEAGRYLAFCDKAARVYRTVEAPFITSERPNPLGLFAARGFAGMEEMLAIEPFSTLWQSLGKQFRDRRLRQLFARYATYCGASPFAAPATLMLVAHVEQAGVWMVRGGMHRLAETLAYLALNLGVRMRLGESVAQVTVSGGRAAGVRLESGETIPAGAVIWNGDVSALAAGLAGPGVARAAAGTPPDRRSLSALTVSMLAEVKDFPLLRHSVFFCTDYAREFDDIFTRDRLPEQPTVYICAQDRGAAADQRAPQGEERLFAIINAPAAGDRRPFDTTETEPCLRSAFELLDHCGLTLPRAPEKTVVTTPADFERLFPATGGALYGPANHGWRASFSRSGARTRLEGLYLTGGSVHPGAGVPMAALSGQRAAESVLKDLTLPSRSRRAVISGGTSTR